MDLNRFHDKSRTRDVNGLEDEVITQVESIDSEDPELESNVIDTVECGSSAMETNEPPNVAEVGSTSHTADIDKEEPDLPAEANNSPSDQPEDIQVEAALSSAEDGITKLAAWQDTDQPPEDSSSRPTSPAASEPTAPSDDSAVPADDNISVQQDSDIAASRWVGDGRIRPTGQQSAQARLQEAIDKVEQLDRSLEKKLKENLVGCDWCTQLTLNARIAHKHS